MKLKSGFIARELTDEQIMVSASGDFSGFIRSNKTAAFIVNCLETDTTKEEIIEKMLEKYDAPKEVITEDVEKILDTLRSVGALDE